VVNPVVLVVIVYLGNKDPQTGDHMLQDEESDQQIDQSLRSRSYLQHISEVSDHFVFDIH
jgi:hypothetical protein